MVGINWHPILQGLEPEKVSFYSNYISKFPYMVFCSGMPRSASRWSQETCEELEKLRTPVDRIDCGYLGEIRISGKGALIVDAFVANAIKKNYGALIFQSHSFGARVVQIILSGLAKNVYTYRDPRDSIASIMRKERCEYEPAFDFVYSSLMMFELFSVDNNSLILPYSETINDPIGTTAKIANYLDFDLTEEQIEKVHLKTQRLAIDRRNEQRRKSAYSSKDMKIIDQSLQTLYGKPTDAPNIKNPWRYSSLNKTQYADATKKLRIWLLKINYSMSPIAPWNCQ